jgi:lipid II:glycine glycyltransferase (peptidoglycan interpeptide bridge formation enzyme)
MATQGIQEQAAWDQRVRADPAGHVLQSWGWGELKGRFGWRVERVAVDGALAQVLFRPLPGGLGSIAYVPKGPLADWAGTPVPRELLPAIRPLARRHRAICLTIEPNLDEDVTLAARLAALGFKPGAQSIQPRRTILVDLDGSPDDILARMKQKTRYNVRLAARKGVTVRPGGLVDLPAFYELMQTTARRDGFAIHSHAYYQAAHELFVPVGQGHLLLAEVEGRLLAGLMAMALGKTACYMYGASASELRELMPTYLLQWEAMLWAREQGCLEYDLWGVPDEDEATLEAQFQDRHDGLWGVYRFKRGFGGRLVRTIGAWDLVYAPLRYRLYRLALAVREKAAARETRPGNGTPG